MIPFVKTQALGNDFILVEQGRIPHDAYSDLATRICDRHHGIGADGLIVWSAGGDGCDLRIFNMDGSEAECSGNGLRCMAAYLAKSEQTVDLVQLRTVSGTYLLRPVGDRFQAEMGEPCLEPRDIPFVAPTPMERVVNYPLEVDNDRVRITACSTGNPHCSVFVDAIGAHTPETLGPKLEHHPAFPNRTNVEFIRIRNRSEIEVAFWERGVGETFASGTGSCGATVASILNGRTERKVRVHTRGGILDVEWPEGGNLTLTSTANVVAEGQYLEDS
jgi:diaminopimelate epimerase